MQNQEEQIFTQILEDNKGRIYRICRIYAVSPIEPQDLFQEVVFHIWKSYGTFKGKSNISTWIYKIALNVCNHSKMKFERNNSKTTRLDYLIRSPYLSFIKNNLNFLSYFYNSCH